MTDCKNKILALLLGCSSPLFACGPFLPATFLDEEDAKVYGVDERELVYHLSLLAEHFMTGEIPPSPRSAEQDPPGPRKEYELYEAGVREITENPQECFPKAWEELLQLPPEERRYRTVRTLYMLGNLALRNGKDDEEAWKYYRELRRAVRDEGFPDNLALSLDTFNAQRRYSSTKGQLRALPLAARFRASKIVYHTELEDIVKRLPESERSEVMRDPYLAELLLLADPRGVRSAGHTFLLADRLAMRAYQKGNFELCADLLKQTPDNSLIKLFLQARFARFSGDTEKTVRLLRKWLELSGSALETSPNYVFRRQHEHPSEWSEYTDFEWKREVHGLLGLVTLDEGDFQEALHAFLEAGSWPDAALVAEQYMSIEALQNFVDSRAETGRNDKNQRELIHLLVRALLRQGKVEDAVRYSARLGSLGKAVKEYRDEWNAFHSSRDPEEKARSMFRIARIQLQYNIELLGYEFDPDFHICDGQYAYYTPWNRRRKNNGLPRFHYRKTIAESFRQAAELTKNSELKFVSWLAAGWTLQKDDPAGADPFYKQICRSGIKPAADFFMRNKWFPPCPKEWRQRFCRLEPSETALREYIGELTNSWQAAESVKPEMNTPTGTEKTRLP